jgi:hypothetical protein
MGKPLLSEKLLKVSLNRLDRHRFLEKMRQHFWERWRNKYLNELQQKSKWRVKQNGFYQGDLVIIEKPNLPLLNGVWDASTIIITISWS